MANQLTPGRRTSEFAITAAVALISVLAQTGVIGPSDASDLADAATKIVSGIVGAVVVVNYVLARTRLKLGK